MCGRFALYAPPANEKDAPPGSPYVRSCTVITTPAGADMEGIHDATLIEPA